MTLVLGVPPAVLELQQQGLLERAFHDALFPKLLYRQECSVEDWPANTGTTVLMSKPGLLPPITTPTTPGSDPPDQTLNYEQWFATLEQYSGSLPTHIPTAVTANANLFLRNIQQLGMQAGQSVNRLARNRMFKDYLGAQTNALTTIGSSDTTIRVAALNGFRYVVIPGTNVAPQPVSSSYPMQATVGTAPTTATVSIVGVVPDNASDPDGPGTLQLAAAVGTAFATTRTPVIGAYAPLVVNSAGGTNIDNITAGDTLTLQQVINAVALLRNANVMPHEDGYYHAHIGALSVPQLYADPVFQRLNQSLPNGDIYQTGFVDTINGIKFFLNTESPLYASNNVGKLTATASSGVYAADIGSEIVNGNGVQIGMVLITGRGITWEKRLDESNYVTEAGTTGKIGQFDVVNNGIQVITEGIRLIIRAPLDKLQQVVSVSWSISTSFSSQTDYLAQSGPQAYKRGIVLRHAA